MGRRVLVRGATATGPLTAGGVWGSSKDVTATDTDEETAPLCTRDGALQPA
ncbi:hypothetical protein AB5J52_24340 [Streptomyces sp. R39]|uniref:Uncharacterized protein n=1 Tax=Streptomyces sp. R39 TaxID=3238631 RepID=A0AB39QNT5_9ACTN